MLILIYFQNPDESIRQIKAELEDALAHRAELESRVLALERDKERLEHEKILQEHKAQEVCISVETFQMIQLLLSIG